MAPHAVPTAPTNGDAAHLPTPTPSSSSAPPKCVIIGLAGPTCCGKTTLAKHLNQILPRSLILHQDDFAPPSELIPIHPIYGVQDWDDVKGAVEWPRQRTTLHYVRSTATLPAEHDSHDHLNEQIPCNISDKLRESWREKFRALDEEMDDRQGGRAESFVIADGFLMLCDKESVREFDVRIFVREEYEVLKRRREERHGYVSAFCSFVGHPIEGCVIDEFKIISLLRFSSTAYSRWVLMAGTSISPPLSLSPSADTDPTSPASHKQDPPGYWDQIVWPAYISAHQPLFVKGDVEHGIFDSKKIDGVVLLEAGEMEDMVNKACEAVYERVRSGKTAKDWSSP